MTGTVSLQLIGPRDAVRTRLENYVHPYVPSQGYYDELKPVILDLFDRNNTVTGLVQVNIYASATQHLDGEDSETGGTGLPDGPVMQSFNFSLVSLPYELIT